MKQEIKESLMVILGALLASWLTVYWMSHEPRDEQWDGPIGKSQHKNTEDSRN